MNSPDWSRILEKTYVLEEGCWRGCDGFCCGNNHPDFAFSLLPLGGTTMVYMEDEYRWLAARGEVPESSDPDAPPTVVSLDFGGPRALRLYFASCCLLGRCQDVLRKPFLCRIYPHLPLFSPDGTFVDILPASIFELTFEILGQRTPCSLSITREDYRRRWEANPALLAPLRHPYILFNLGAAKAFVDNYASALRNDTSLTALTGRDFWAKWEMCYLSKRLVDVASLREAVGALYASLCAIYGEDWFTPSDAGSLEFTP